MPLRPAAGTENTGIGMGVHFLLGNVIAVHNGFREFWFGWRYKKIFTEKRAFDDYCHRPDGMLDVAAVGRAQGIRYWIEGHYRVQGGAVITALTLTDVEKGKRCDSGDMSADTVDQLIGYRIDVMNWMAGCGLAFPDVQMARVIWSEELSLEALDALGRGLETFYTHTAYGGEGPVDVGDLERSVALAPDAYLPHDLLGWVQFKNKDYGAAEASFNASIAVNPAGVGAMSGLRLLGAMRGDARMAYAWAEAKAETRGEDVQAAREKTTKLLKKYASK
jgi:hypothetical protein